MTKLVRILFLAVPFACTDDPGPDGATPGVQGGAGSAGVAGSRSDAGSAGKAGGNTTGGTAGSGAGSGRSGSDAGGEGVVQGDGGRFPLLSSPVSLLSGAEVVVVLSRTRTPHLPV